MALEIIAAPPATDSFTPLSAHQSRTPESFFGGKPVLYYEDKDARIVASRDQLDTLPIFRQSGSTDNGADEGASANGHDARIEDVLITDIGIWVTSQHLILYNFSSSTGIVVPYPSILLHAIQRRQMPGASPGTQEQGIYMQLSIPNPSDNSIAEEEYDDSDVADLSIFPSSAQVQAATTTTTSTPRDEDDATSSIYDRGTSTPTNQSPVQSLFAAISTCSNLHPDPAAVDDEENDLDGLDDDDEADNDDPIIFEGSVGYDSTLVSIAGGGGGGAGLPPPLPGSSGWITAENVGEYFDDDGNWRRGGAGGLGPGAGTVRTRGSEGPSVDDHEGVDNNVVNGKGDDEDQPKWRRTG